jgi:hypothetical protein
MIPPGAVAADERTAVLVVRAWVEEAGEEPELRARITRTADVSAARAVQTAAASREEILSAVDEWLRAIVTHP